MKKVLPLLATILLAVWVTTRWDAWFHNPEELPYTPPSTPHRLLLTFGDSLELSRNVSWQCDTVLRPSHLELLCIDDSTRQTIQAYGEVFDSRNGRAAYYVARLRTLAPDRHYAYRAITAGKASPWHTFRTYPTHRATTSFLYVGDVQDTLGGITNQILQQAFARHPQCEMLVCGGDFVERPTNQDWQVAFDGIDSIAQQRPMLCVTGNHDYLKGVIMQLERRFTLTFSYFLDSEIADNHVYTLHYGPLQIFLLDSNRELPYLFTQRTWLKQQLANSQAPWKVVVLHHPLYSLKGNNNLIQRWMFNDLIQQYGVDLVLQGHEHAYARMTQNLKAPPVYTVSHCSPKNYRINFDPQRFDKYGISSRYYQTVTISHDTLAMATYDAYHHTLYDSLLIIKSQSSKFKDQSSKITDLGIDIPEYLEFTPDPNSTKDQDFAQRISQYRQQRSHK